MLLHTVPCATSATVTYISGEQAPQCLIHRGILAAAGLSCMCRRAAAMDVSDLPSHAVCRFEQSSLLLVADTTVQIASITISQAMIACICTKPHSCPTWYAGARWLPHGGNKQGSSPARQGQPFLDTASLASTDVGAEPSEAGRPVQPFELQPTC